MRGLTGNYEFSSPNESHSKSNEELKNNPKRILGATPNEIAEQNKVSKRIQQEGKCVPDFIVDLRKLSKSCQFNCASFKASTIHDYIRQQFISGAQDSKLLEQLIQLRSPNNTLKHCIDIVWQFQEKLQKPSK